MPDGELSLQILTMPRDTNHSGTVFGGYIMSLVDQAAYVHCRRVGLHNWVTVAVDRVEFLAPVFVGELVTLRTTTERLGRTSVTVNVFVDAERYSSGEWVRVTQARVTMVSVDAHRQPIPFTTKPTLAADCVSKLGSGEHHKA